MQKTRPKIRINLLQDDIGKYGNYLWCPTQFVGSMCPGVVDGREWGISRVLAENNVFSYYKCCGELNQHCCSHWSSRRCSSFSSSIFASPIIENDTHPVPKYIGDRCRRRNWRSAKIMTRLTNRSSTSNIPETAMKRGRGICLILASIFWVFDFHFLFHE